MTSLFNTYACMWRELLKEWMLKAVNCYMYAMWIMPTLTNTFVLVVLKLLKWLALKLCFYTDLCHLFYRLFLDFTFLLTLSRHLGGFYFSSFFLSAKLPIMTHKVTQFCMLANKMHPKIIVDFPIIGKILCTHTPYIGTYTAGLGL